MAKSRSNAGAGAGKKALIIASSLIVVAFLVIGGIILYSTANPSTVAISEDQTDIQVKNGQEFTITLPSNASTGYSWALSDAYDKNVVTKVNDEYIAPKSSSIGASGEEVWTFKAKSIGSTTLTLEYERSWEGDSSKVNTRAYNVVVE
ncbi:MAG: protease inhibitor I42 family protein [Candidatus Woesebacteria bacterium]|jgi:inhibitor of cysteine peptidase